MPKGVPRSPAERIGDKFDKAYRKMKSGDKSKQAAKCSGKNCSCGKAKK